jgi:hypothetical protein
MRPASGHQITEGGAQVPVQPADFGGIKRSCASPWGETRPPQHLIGYQIADTGEALLVKQTGFEGRPRTAQRRCQLGWGHSKGVWPKTGEVRVELHRSEDAGVAHVENSTSGVNAQPDPRRVAPRRSIDEFIKAVMPVNAQHTRHSEPQPKALTVGPQDQHLADTFRLGECPAP